MKGIIIQGSSRSNGNSAQVASFIEEKTGYEVVNLCEKQIGHFDYEFNNREDDFPPLIKSIAANFDNILFVTPVYWYSMSGLMKVFFDRISDCLIIDKVTGRKLRGKNMGVVSCGSDAKINAEFYMPFKESADYLGMRYLGEVHTWIQHGSIPPEIENAISKFLGSF